MLEKIREAKETAKVLLTIFPKINNCPNYAEHNTPNKAYECLETFINLANSILQCEGVPEKREHEKWCKAGLGTIGCNCGASGANAMHDAFTIYLAKQKLEWEERAGVEKIYEIIRNLDGKSIFLNFGSNPMVLAQAISNYLKGEQKG